MNMFFDPGILAVISLWGGVAAGVAAPVALAARSLIRFRGRRRNAKNWCARCKARLGRSDDISVFVVDGLKICESCADSLRVALQVGLPVAAAGILGLGLLSSIGLLFGSPAVWTVSGVVIPRVLVGLAPLLVSGGGVVTLVQLAKRANRTALGAGTDGDDLVAEDDPVPSLESGAS